MRIDFSELGKYFFDIANIFVVRQEVSGKTRFTMHEPRPTDGLLFFSSTTGICYQKDMLPMIVPHGALVYLPKDSNYIWENSPALNNGMQEQLLFEFTLSFAQTQRGDSIKRELSRTGASDTPISFGDRVRIVTTQHTMLYRRLFSTLLEAFCAPRFSPLAVYSSAYEIFNTLSNNCRIEHENVADTRVIKDSINLLESSERMSINEIAAACNVSIGHFERLFRIYAGMSPNEYRSMYRINQIKMHLQREDIGLERIAEEMGYCDSGYLCRIFKKRTGMTPSEYRKMYLVQTQKIDRR